MKSSHLQKGVDRRELAARNDTEFLPLFLSKSEHRGRQPPNIDGKAGTQCGQFACHLDLQHRIHEWVAEMHQYWHASHATTTPLSLSIAKSAQLDQPSAIRVVTVNTSVCR